MTRRHVTWGALALACALLGCEQTEGERCNPNLFESECSDGLTCVYPTAPMCGVAYCCAMDTDGNVVDPHPSCRADPSLACAPDGGATSDPDLSSVD